jgi:predicted Zn-dependent protease
MLRRLLPVFPLGRVIRRRPWTTCLVLTFLLLAGTAAGLYGYALHEWHAARRALAEDRTRDARASLDFCLRVWPRSPEVLVLAARAARLDGDFEGADAHLRQCMRLESGATEATQLEYLLMRAQTGDEEAVEPTLRGLADNHHPETALIAETLAAAYMHHLRYGPAYTWLTRWVKAAPQSAKPLHLRGWVLERLNNVPEAMEDYRRAVELEPDHLPARLRLAELYLETNHPLEALPHLEILRKEMPGRSDVVARLGHCRLLRGEVKEARRLMEAAVKELPDDPPLLFHLGQLELQEGQAVLAEAWLRRALKADPANPIAQHSLASALRLQGRPQEAADLEAEHARFQEILARADKLLGIEAMQPSRDPATPSEVGALLLSIGQDKQGLHWLNQALQRDPAHEPTHRVLADYYERRGEREKAAAHRRWLTSPPGPAAQPTASR